VCVCVCVCVFKGGLDEMEKEILFRDCKWNFI